MTASVISLVDERRHRRTIERLHRQVERDLRQVLSLLVRRDEERTWQSGARRTRLGPQPFANESA